jgi:hypothetical protein
MKGSRVRLHDRPMSRLGLSAFGAGLVTLTCVVASCEDTSPPIPCVDAPPDGCPEDFGADVCQDRRCDSVYACNDGHWAFVRACGARDGASDPDVPEVDGDAGYNRDSLADLDAPSGAFGGPGCIPLQAPDCPLGVALVCSSSVDCCGCQDLFLCADGGWEPWGLCADGGIIAR